MNESHPSLLFLALAGYACAYHLGFAVFHVLFHRLFGWRKQLPRLSAINQGVLPVLNWCLSFVFFGAAAWFAALAAGHRPALDVLIFTSAFWLLRLVLQPVYFGTARASVIFSLIFLSGAIVPAGMAWLIITGF